MRRLAVIVATTTTLVPVPASAARPATPLELCSETSSIARALCLRGVPSFPLPGSEGAAEAADPEDPECPLPGLDERCEAWATTYDNPNGAAGFGPDQVTAMDAGGGRVFVTGGSWDDTTAHYDVLTAAYDQDTGAEVWTARYDGPGGLFDAGFAVDADGSSVYVAGTRDGPDTFGGDPVVVAHDAETGDVVWATSYDAGDHGTAYAVTAVGGTVFAAGTAHEPGTDEDLVVVALDADDGTLRWAASYDGAGGVDAAFGVRASQERVVAAGLSQGLGGDTDQVAVAFRTRDDPQTEQDEAGSLAWAAREDGGGADEAYAIDMTPDGSGVVIAGLSLRDGAAAFLTSAYDTLDGTHRWSAVYQTQPTVSAPSAVATSVAISPEGDRAYVGGIAAGEGETLGYGFATVAYRLADGEEVWASPFHPLGTTYGWGTSVAVTPDGSTVLATGPSFAGFFVMKGDYATIALDAATGAREWAARFTRPADDVADLLPYASFVTTGDRRAFVAGTYVNYYQVDGSSTFSDYWTFAYDLPPSGLGAVDPHPPIDIVGDEGPTGFVLTHDPQSGEPVYRPGSGVVDGLGTEDAPYVIAGWDVDALALRDTTAHVEIRGNRIGGLPPDPAGATASLSTEGSRDVLIAGNEIAAASAGIRLAGGARVEVTGNRLAGGTWGIASEGVEGLRFEGNEVIDAGYGLTVLGGSGLEVEANRFVDTMDASGAAVWMSEVEGATVRANAIERHHTGVYVISTPGVVVEGNEITSFARGVNLWFTEGSRIERNAMAGQQVGGVILVESGDATVADNEVAGSVRALYSTGPAAPSRFVGNAATDAREGVVIAGSGGHEVEGNTLTGNEYGVLLYEAPGVAVSGNLVADNGVGLLAVQGTGGLIVAGNQIRGNGTGLRNEAAEHVDARENWWGCPAGPGEPGCDTVEGEVLVDPWLLEPPLAG